MSQRNRSCSSGEMLILETSMSVSIKPGLNSNMSSHMPEFLADSSRLFCCCVLGLVAANQVHDGSNAFLVDFMAEGPQCELLCLVQFLEPGFTTPARFWFGASEVSSCAA